MNFEEIRRYTEYGSVCVDISLAEKYSGFVRQIFFYGQNRVCIEFIGFGIDDEQGYEFCHTFSSLEEAVNVIEAFLEKPVSAWINHTKTGKYPDKSNKMDVEKGAEILLQDISSGKVSLPGCDLFKPKFTI
jgi:hypothetical protein